MYVCIGHFVFMISYAHHTFVRFEHSVCHVLRQTSKIYLEGS